jgi:acetyl esterase/lipase
VAEPIPVWPASPPGRIAAKGDERDTSDAKSNKVAGKPVIRIGNVSKPTLTIYSPAADKANGAAVMVCPGGGYNILAWDLEGTEVCEWFNSIGVTAALLKYRVPRPENDAMPIEPLQDAQRAMSILRSRATELNIDPKRIGVLGFSAGGNLSARLSTNYDKRAYETLDQVDATSCRPDFTMLIYPAYLFSKDSEAGLSANLPVNAETPPAFLTMAFDDPVDSNNVLRWATALKQSKVPVALHLYPSGGHGYGLRRTENASTTWPDRASEWLAGQGWLSKP